MLITPRTAGVVVMGVVNVTPDSFSDGGRYTDVDAAVAHARALVADGADVVDVGGESTRPGAVRPGADEELARVLPVVEALAGEGVVVSVDTMRASVARAVVDAGAAMINDVSGGLADDEMADVVAATGVPYVLQHWRAHSDVMQQVTDYDDAAREVRDALLARVDALVARGVDRGRVVVDPGFGFSKQARHSWEILARLDELTATGLPVLAGTSRKGFLGAALADADGPRPAQGRDAATAATSLLAAQAGCWGVRVHDVRSTVDALVVLDTVRAHARAVGKGAR